MRYQTCLVFDLETIPDYDLYTRPEDPAGTDRRIPPPYAQQVVVIGALWLGADYSFRRLGIVDESDESSDERQLLAGFGAFVDKQRPLLVSYNGRTFDLPVVVQRSLRHGLSLPWYYRGEDYRYRYSDAGHLDLCDFLADHGASRYPSLNAASKLIGLPGKVGIDGSQVESLYRAKQLSALRNYCLGDVAQTAFLLLRFRLLQGELSLSAYRRAAESLYQALGDDGRVAEVIERTDRKRLLLLE